MKDVKEENGFMANKEKDEIKTKIHKRKIKKSKYWVTRIY